MYQIAIFGGYTDYDEIQNDINKFISDKKVIDIKFQNRLEQSERIQGHIHIKNDCYYYHEQTLTVLVIYEDVLE